MASTLQINDLVESKDLDREARSAICGGLAEQFLFRVASTPMAPIINQFFDYGTHNYNIQDDRDFIFADRGASVLNFGGNTNVSLQSQISSTVNSYLEEHLPSALESAL